MSSINSIFISILFISAVHFFAPHLYAQKIAFSSKLNDSISGIYLLDIDKSAETYITNGDLPVIAPTGKTLAYIEANERFGTGSLNIINLTTGTKKKLISSHACNPQWSADSRYIVFENWANHYSEIFIVDTNGKTIVKFFGQYKNPSFSPDGNKIVVAKDFDIYTLDVKTRKSKRVTNTKNIIERLPTWSPDGNKIAFYAQHKTDAEPRICYINLPENKVYTVINYLSDRFVWTSSNQIMYEVHLKNNLHTQIAIININGTGKKIITDSNNDHYWPSSAR